MPTVSVENYLKAIHHLHSETGGPVKTKELADRLGVSLPSVTSMMKALAASGLVAHAPYRGVVLTAEGERAALRVIRSHRLIEEFLVRTLGYPWEEVHAEAESLEHAVSDRLVARIDAFLGFPRFDPHGDPIPTPDLRLEAAGAVRLSEVSGPAQVRVARALDQQDSVLRWLRECGVVPGAVISVLRSSTGSAGVRIRAGGREVHIDPHVAQRVLVTIGDARAPHGDSASTSTARRGGR